MKRWKNTTVSNQRSIILNTLIDFMEKGKIIFTYDEVHAVCGCDSKTVYNLFKKMRTHGLIRKIGSEKNVVNSFNCVMGSKKESTEDKQTEVKAEEKSVKMNPEIAGRIYDEFGDRQFSRSMAQEALNLSDDCLGQTLSEMHLLKIIGECEEDGEKWFHFLVNPTEKYARQIEKVG